MEESQGHRRTYRGSTIAEAMSHSTTHTSVLAGEELRIFEELISRFDSLTEAEMSAVGVTREWSAKDLLTHLAYSERAAADHVRDFGAGKWRANKRTRTTAT